MGLLLAAAISIFVWLRRKVAGKAEPAENSVAAAGAAPAAAAMRDFARAEIRLPALITDSRGNEFSGESRNISGTGIFIACEQRFVPGEFCDIKLLSASSGPIEFRGRVTWSNQHLPREKVSESGAGFGFVALSAGTRNRLERLLRENLDTEDMP